MTWHENAPHSGDVSLQREGRQRFRARKGNRRASRGSLTANSVEALSQSRRPDNLPSRMPQLPVLPSPRESKSVRRPSGEQVRPLAPPKRVALINKPLTARDHADRIRPLQHQQPQQPQPQPPNGMPTQGLSPRVRYTAVRKAPCNLSRTRQSSNLASALIATCRSLL